MSIWQIGTIFLISKLAIGQHHEPPPVTSHRHLPKIGLISIRHLFLGLRILQLQTKLRDFSPQPNYTYLANASCRRSCCQLLRIKGVSSSEQRIPTAVGLRFLDPEHLFFNSSSSSIILPENLVVPEIELGISGSVARNSDH
jgi:hypothetical protein